MKYLLLFFILISPAHAWQLLELKEFNLEFEKHIHDGRDAIIYPEALNEKWRLNFDTWISEYILWKNTVHATTTDGQFRHVSWEYRLEVNVSSQLDIFMRHHSYHLLDRHHEFMNKFPVEDAIGIRLHFFSSDQNRRPIFGF